MTDPEERRPGPDLSWPTPGPSQARPDVSPERDDEPASAGSDAEVTDGSSAAPPPESDAEAAATSPTESIAETEALDPDSLPPLPRTRHLGDVQRFFGLEALAAEPELEQHDEEDDVYSWRRELEAAR